MDKELFILASESERRKDIFKLLNINFHIKAANIDEKKIKLSKKRPHLYCMNMAKQKANSISKKYKNNFIIGADTIVFFKKQILEKPNNFIEAKKYLSMLSNNIHTVYTGVYIRHYNKNINIKFYDKTNITFYNLIDKDINYYINNHEPFDKAGAYGIQDWSCLFAKKINGCFYNVVGFPISKFYQILIKNKINLF